MDPTGTFLGLLIRVGIQALLPGVEDLIIRGLQALVEAYVVNLMWDIEWAQDMSLPNSWESRLDNSWVYSALRAELHDAFDVGIPFTDVTFNPLDAFADIAARSEPLTRSFGRRFRASHSFKHTFYYKNREGIQTPALVAFYRNQNKLGHLKVVIFPDAAIVTSVNIDTNPLPKEKVWRDLDERQKSNLSQSDLRRATKQLRQENGGELPHGYKAINNDRTIEIYGVPHIWHHDTKRGRMQLVSRDLQEQTIEGEFQHTGHATWHATC